MQPLNGTPVSDDLNSVLNRIAGDLPRQDDVSRSFLTERELASSFSRCTWWGGCYYCQDASGRWQLIHCVA